MKAKFMSRATHVQNESRRGFVKEPAPYSTNPQYRCRLVDRLEVEPITSQRAIGRTIRSGASPRESIQIVGVVGDIRSLGSGEPAPPAV
jgi:hypothetical protein